MLRFLVALAALAALLASPFCRASGSGGPKPDTYLCPNALGGKAVDCFLDAVAHLYTMCRQVKSIEIIEFGYEKSDEGVNGAKSEYCVDKHKMSMTRPYQAALREAAGNRNAVDGLRALYDRWLKALAEFKWKPGETDEQYKERIAKPYADFTERATAVRVAMDEGAAKASGPPPREPPRRRRRRRRRRRPRPPRPRARTERADCRAAARRSRACDRPSTRRHLRRRRRPRPDAPGLSLPSAATRDGRRRRAGDRRARAADRRSRHRHRQDLRLPRSGAALRRQGDRLDRHQDAAGPAVPARPADGPRCAARAGDARAAQRARELRVPPSSRAHGRGGPAALARRCTAPAEDHRLRAGERDRRPRPARRRSGKRVDLAAGHVDARQLPRQPTARTTANASC